MRAVLMFHSVDDSDSVLSVSAAELASLVSTIRRSGHRIVRLAELLNGTATSDCVAFTFDDGLDSLRTGAMPLLSDLAVPATLFLTCGRVGLDNQWPGQAQLARPQPMLNWTGIEALRRVGWDIQAHTMSHPDLRAVSEQQLHEELAKPIETIEARLGHRCTQFAYPYGYLDARVVSAVARYYQLAVTTTLSSLGGRPTPLQLPRLDSYYFRRPTMHKFFGTRAFDGYLRARRALRRARRHPGETPLAYSRAQR